MRKLLAVAMSAAALCAAAVTMKPGYRYHREVLPSDRVPVDMELVMSNYLAEAGYVPSHVTNTETVVYSVTNNFTEVHDVTNNFYEVREFTNVFHQVTNILTRETVEITNNVTRNFYTEHWYTNNLYEVRELTNVVHEVNEITNNITQVFSNEYRNVVYETTNRTEYVTNNVTDEIWHTIVYSNVIENVISNRWIYDHRETTVTNNLVTWATNVLTEVREFTNNFTDVFWYTNNTHEVRNVTNNLYEVREVTNNFTDVFWYTNNVTLNVTNNFYEEHWHTNNIHTVETNEFYNETYNTVIITNSIVVPVTNNFYNETWITNNIVLDRTNNIHTVTFSNVYWTVHEDFYHTNYETRVVSETNYTHEVHTNVEEYYIFTTEEITNKVIQLREITNVYVQSNVTENVFNTITNNYSRWFNDRITATNGMEVSEIDAMNRKWTRINEEGFYGKIISSPTVLNTFDGASYSKYTTFWDNPYAVPVPLNTSEPLDRLVGYRGYYSSETNDIGTVLYGRLVPFFEYFSSKTNLRLGFVVLGGWIGTPTSTRTNWVTATTSPALNSVLRVSNKYYEVGYVTWDPNNYTVVRANLPSSFSTYTESWNGTSTYYLESWYDAKKSANHCYRAYSGKTGSTVPSSITWNAADNPSSKVITNRTYEVDQLATFGDLEKYATYKTAEEVVSNPFFIETMEDAMLPYTFASYTNMVQAAGYARQAATDAQTVIDYMETADQKISAAISMATADAIAAKNLAQSYASTAQTAQNNANNAASRAQTAQAKAEFAYDLIQTFTNWFYEAVESGGVVTNVHVYNPAYKIETENYIMDLHNMSVQVRGGKTLVMQAYNTYGSWLTGITCTGVGVSDPGGLSVRYGDGSQYMSSYGIYRSRLVSLHWSLSGFWYAVVNTTTTTGGSSYMTTFRAAGGAYLPTNSSLSLAYYSGQQRTSSLSIPSSISIRRESSSQSRDEMIEVASYLTNVDIENMIAAEANARSQADMAEADARSQADMAEANARSQADMAEADARSQADMAEADARSQIIPNLMADLTSILSQVGRYCTYDVYFDQAGKVQGSFAIDTARYSESGGTRTYEIFNLTGGPNTSSGYGRLSSVLYTWIPSSGALSVKLTGTTGSYRTYTTTQDNPIAHYYGAAWSMLKTSESQTEGGGYVINTSGKTYLNPLVTLMKAAANTNTIFIIAQ